MHRISAGWIASALIVVALGAAYANSLTGEFVFDDATSIPENPTIRHLWPLSGALAPPRGTGATVEGRPVLNLSFAVNFALGGTAVRGYHVANLAIHALACLVLFGVIRRTLEGSGRFPGRDALPVACVCALIFGLHPLQTESVSYIVQRAESLMGLLFLVSLYGTIRAAGSHRPSAWMALSIAAAWLCAGTKEVAVVLPIVVFLYDRTFLAGSFAGAWRKRRWLYAGLSAGWLILALLALSTGDRSGTIGPRSGVAPWDYALCQSRAVFHYLRLCFWPAPLILDYGSDLVPFGQALPWVVAVLAVLAATAWALVKRPAAGFLGAWFFLILAPTSSFMGGARQMLAEHRMYLPLAAVAAGTVLLLHRLLGRKAIALGGIIAAALAVATSVRNEALHDNLSLYTDTVRHRPGNAWAHYNLALSLERAGRAHDALAQYGEALRLKPDYPDAHNNLGLLLAGMPGGQAEALAHYEAALRLKPDYFEAHNNLANLLAGTPGGQAEALAHYEAALRLKPEDADVHNNLANVLAGMPGRRADALAHYEAALRLSPEDAKVHNNLANLLAGMPGRQADAIAHYETALRLMPDSFVIHLNFACVLEPLPGMTQEAVRHFRAALELNPDCAKARTALERLGAGSR